MKYGYLEIYVGIAYVVDDKKSKTLYNIILANSVYGTTIVSDSWKGYHFIDLQPLLSVYNHTYVDHLC